MDKNQKDIEWLGEADAHLGPAARAALGILVAANEWAWWDDPSLASASLDRVVPKHGFVKWGGDSGVAEADQWVDPLRAIAIAGAFNSLPRYPLRIKILRAVWTWPDGADFVEKISAELSLLVGPEGVFSEWRSKAKPRFTAMALQDGRRIVASPSLPSQTFESSLSQHVAWAPDATVADVVVADSIKALRVLSAAHVVVLYGAAERELLDDIDFLRSSLGAQCAMRVDANASQIADWLRPFFAHWEQRKQSVVDAFEAANEQSGIRARFLSSTQSFLLSKTWFHEPPSLRESMVAARPKAAAYYLDDSLDNGVITREAAKTGDAQDPRDGKFDGADAILDFNTQATSPSGPFAGISQDRLSRGIEVPRGIRPSPPIERVLDAKVKQGKSLLSKWPTHGPAEVDISICTKSPLHDQRHSFPQDRIEWKGDSKTLQVHLFELDRPPMTKELILPRTGDSASVRFTREVGGREIDLRFIVSDGARILQTARLKSAPGADIHFSIENIVTPVHRSKQGFDVAVLVNESLGRRPSMTVITADGQALLSPLTNTETENARNGLLAVLQRAVANPTEPLAPLLLELASLGATLFRELRENVPGWPSAHGRVQLVTQSNAFFPIEYLYDGVLPESDQAPLCPEHKGCLQSGQAIGGCPIRTSQQALCPMGFMGVSGIVERHTWRDGSNALVWPTLGGATLNRERIVDLSEIAFAASDQADDFDDKDVTPYQPVRIADIAKSLGSPRIVNWSEWKNRIAGSKSPSMLVLIVHMENASVHIESTSGVPIGSLSTKYVGSAPVTIAIGCSTGLGQVPGSSLPTVLRRCGARVVIAAMTDVLGRHANRAARDLALRLRDAAESTVPTLVGQVVSELRRGLLSDGLALGLAIVAFGDADVVLGGA